MTPRRRRILPSPARRAAFFALGLAAAAVRAATAPWRAVLARRARGAARPVLVFEPFGMGDALLLQPLVRAHLAAGRRVALAARAAWAPLFPPAPGFSFVPVAPAWADPDPARKYARPLRDLLATARALRPAARGADCIDPRGDPRSILALTLAGAARVFSLPRYWSATDCRLPPLAARFVPLDRDAPRRVVSRAFAPGGVPYGRPDLSHLVPPGAARDPRAVALVPLTPWEGKRWPPSHWAELIAALRAKGFRPVVLCGPGESAAAAAATGGEPAPGDCPPLPPLPPLSTNPNSQSNDSAGSAPSACPTTAGHAPEVLEAKTVSDWVRLLSTCGAAVCVNTGPMHVADALDLPLVVVDGASRLPLWAPEGPRSAVVEHQDRVPWAPVHPTSSNGPAVQRGVMALVRPDEVLSALERVLSR